MRDLLICRICLATDIKLFNLHKYKLVESYEMLTQTKVSDYDRLPQHTCSYCSTLLLKSAQFKRKCSTTQDLLKYSLTQQEMPALHYLNTIDRRQKKLVLPYKTNTIHNVDITEESDSMNNKVKDEITDSSDEDEEPLAIMKKLYNKKNEDDMDEFDMTLKEEDSLMELSPINQDNADLFETITQYDTESKKYGILDADSDIQVIVLNKEEQFIEFNARKSSLNYLNSFYKCDKCFKGFITDATFKNHMIKHDSTSGNEVCEICECRFTSVRTLRAHIATTHERKYVCKKCNHVSKTGHSAREHSKWHNGFTYICKICGASFGKSTSHLTHIRLHHPTNNVCDLCGECFIGEYGLKMHKKKVHRDNVVKKIEYSCDVCSARFKALDALKRHMAMMKNNLCDDDLRPCIHCGEGLESEASLKEHLKMHRKESSVECEQCGRRFAHERSLSAHTARVHAGRSAVVRQRAQRAVVCELCGKTCISKASLVYHQRTHTGERPYACTECPKRFSVSQRLQIHLRTHTGERPFQCTHCPKAFKHKAALNRHHRVHTGAKPYACTHCGKTFSQSNSMKTHVRTVHLKLPALYRNRKIKNE